MAKVGLLCPFTHSSCTLCGLYRARHYYAGFCGTIRRKGKDDNAIFVDFDELMSLHSMRPERELPNVKLRVIDMESGETRICELSEAQGWDFGNPEIIRMVNGIHITSFENLARVIRFIKRQESEMVDLYEGHRVILLGGG
jgi:hypothetical protein